MFTRTSMAKTVRGSSGSVNPGQVPSSGPGRHTSTKSFLRKLFGSGSEDKPSAPSDREAARPAPSGPKPARPPAGPPPTERIPTLADTAPRQLHAYFEYVGGASS